ncbi:PTS sugar transporter subunit IIA [Oceanobacillus manasiensis]|uniref:PTS sugar transporter subunit IIA n=1 Tax=Oceanobacillus manasiensis TaxID=586413 RepID=UPI0005A73552|nr:PTS sugar transporter subunit IIA [Oceanobacillus manasiensis]
MENNLLYHVYFDCGLTTKEEVHTFISEMVCQEDPSQQEEIINQLNDRDMAGSTLIAEHVMLPHIESDKIKKSQIMFIRLANPILSWNWQTKDIRLLIVILLKENEDEQVKKRISSFTRTLADEAYLSRLLNCSDEETLNKEIKKT